MTQLLHWIKNYQTSHEEERAFLSRFEKLLEHPRAFHRDHLPGHITGSTCVVNAGRNRLLLLHHKNLNKWLQPGGHADGDEDVLRVAMRELSEETGLKNTRVLLGGIFDLDIHPIPARKGFPNHDHYDVRFLIEADDDERFIVSEESLAIQWVAIDKVAELTTSRSVLRMVEKIRMSGIEKWRR